MKKRNSNKGFSLVELIVVIAIMAVLIGLLAPQFVKYVGQSEDSRDTANLETVRRAANIVVMDVNVVKNDGDTYTLASTGITGGEQTFRDAFTASFGAAGISNLPASASYTITINEQADGGFTATVN